MKIEVLSGEVCNLYGDLANIRYLSACAPEAKIAYTALHDTPCFVSERVDMVYLGPMSERFQLAMIDKLLPLKGRIRELIDDGVVFLFTGNAMELLEKYIRTPDEQYISALGLIDAYAKQDFHERHNSLFLGAFEDIEIVGYKSQFTHSFGDNSRQAFCQVRRGVGLNPASSLEGYHIHNLFATYLLGPLLLLNPPFTKKLLGLLGVKQPRLAFEQTATAAYYKRLREYHDPACKGFGEKKEE